MDLIAYTFMITLFELRCVNEIFCTHNLLKGELWCSRLVDFTLGHLSTIWDLVTLEGGKWVYIYICMYVFGFYIQVELIFWQGLHVLNFLGYSRNE